MDAPKTLPHSTQPPIQLISAMPITASQMNKKKCSSFDWRKFLFYMSSFRLLLFVFCLSLLHILTCALPMFRIWTLRFVCRFCYITSLPHLSSTVFALHFIFSFCSIPYDFEKCSWWTRFKFYQIELLGLNH